MRGKSDEHGEMSADLKECTDWGDTTYSFASLMKELVELGRGRDEMAVARWRG
jgi:hypothetical protein